MYQPILGVICLFGIIPIQQSCVCFQWFYFQITPLLWLFVVCPWGGGTCNRYKYVKNRLVWWLFSSLFTCTCTIPSLLRLLQHQHPPHFQTVAALIRVSSTLEEHMLSHVTGANWSWVGFSNNNANCSVLLWLIYEAVVKIQNLGLGQIWCPPTHFIGQCGTQATWAAWRRMSGRHGNGYFHCLLYVFTPQGWSLGICFYSPHPPFFFMEHKY